MAEAKAQAGDTIRFKDRSYLTHRGHTGFVRYVTQRWNRGLARRVYVVECDCNHGDYHVNPSWFDVTGRKGE